jgi:uncharacterized protein YkwD
MGRAIGVVLFAVLLVGIIPAAQAKPVNPRAVRARHHHVCAAGNPSGWALYMETNQAREDHQVHALTVNRRLSNLARRHSRAMATERRMYHTPDPSVYLDGLSWNSWGENVGYTTGETTDVQRAFMQSLVHRHNILNGGFQHVAVGSVRVDGILWVTLFFYG